MAPASENTVLGDFDNAVFEHFGRTSRFFRKNGDYFVSTQGPEGKTGEFQITHTFGWYPLQQYLVPFPGGRLQCLPIAWDARNDKWYHLYPEAPLDPNDWIYWTNNGQNWNAMCAECHSTNLNNNYDHRSDTYATTWSEIHVGCEACHGPGSAHIDWARHPKKSRPSAKNAALTVQTSAITAKAQIEICAPCHSRRISLDDNTHRHADFLDYGIPQLLIDGMYYADGQILDEVYVYGSFIQSEMYAQNVRCSDCHNVHSLRRIKEGDNLCLQCHRASDYDTAAHHFHKKPGEAGEPIRSADGSTLFEVGTGASCEQCHMPGRYYMGIDYRPDHSFRVPRPDLTLAIGTPNACNRCHVDQSATWAVRAMDKRYGKRMRSHYGRVLDAGRKRLTGAVPDLAKLSQDQLYPTIVRATALLHLAGYTGAVVDQAFSQALFNEEAMLRHSAVRYLPQPDPLRRLAQLSPLLYDPVRGVRMEAAARLSDVPHNAMTPADRQQFDKALREYRNAMERTADFAASSHNLGNLVVNLGQIETAVAHYQKAIAIDEQFYPAKVNLAMLYNRLDKNEQAERLLREVVNRNPEFYEIKYSLGLLLAEQRRFEEAAVYLKDASVGMPDRSRIHYNLGLLQQRLRNDVGAESALKAALYLEPTNPEYLYAIAVFYLERGRLDNARQTAEQLHTLHPDIPAVKQLLKVIDQRK